ncbi:uncharacterized protein LOC123877244 isoform X1 [Maniola jurtina]|uniref:uncharacterized protein LOC123877244 isoform X1 n=1 Tax=Maniola jurtina TaxID=191418 RepID=UPI001E68EA38|nr:uncharacterized protein LOC123877244 isoform X1 [Maniola jurtina]
MREFKYDVVQLIHAVRDRPCLWDKTAEVYKDRAERRAAWEQVFSLLEENYEELSSEQKRVTGEQILNKWTNIRDTFVKTLKRSRMGRPRRKYLLYDHVKFLIKVTNTEDDFNVELSTDDNSAYMKTERESPKEIPTTSTRKRSRKSNYSDEEPRRSKEYDKYEKMEDFAEIDECNDPRIMNEDEAFFASLLPSVVKYSEDERLEFRIEVLAVMKRIKEKRNW